MNDSYRILKLQTGEELIARILKRENGKLSVESPMIFRTVLLSDPYTGIQKEMTILKDWVLYTSDKKIKIPEEQILSYNTPMKEAIELYEKEKVKKDNGGGMEIKNLDSMKNDMKDYMKRFLDDMINTAEQFTSEEDSGKSMSDIFNMINAFGPGESLDFEFDVEFIHGEEITDESTEKDMNHPDYGNRWTDWSSDPNEY